VRKRSAPAASAPRSAAGPDAPVNITIVAPAVAGSERSRRHASIPLSCGMSTSRNTISGRASTARSTAWAPFAASSSR
jgi:hypothetical protein